MASEEPSKFSLIYTATVVGWRTRHGWYCIAEVLCLQEASGGKCEHPSILKLREGSRFELMHMKVRRFGSKMPSGKGGVNIVCMV